MIRQEVQDDPRHVGVMPQLRPSIGAEGVRSVAHLGGHGHAALLDVPNPRTEADGELTVFAPNAMARCASALQENRGGAKTHRR